MSKEEIRKLLGGYATNTLTESERSALFEAALDDQELFNALQQEQALKSLLADPATRAEVRQALDRPPVRNPRAAWRLRWWAWGGAVGAVAAAAVLLIVFRPTPATLGERPVQIASAEKPADAIAPPEGKSVPSESKTVTNRSLDAELKRQPRARVVSPSIETRGELAQNATPAPAPAPPPVIPPPVQFDAVQPLPQQGPGPTAQAQGGQVPSQGVVGGVAGSQAPPRSPLAAARISALSTGAKVNTATALHYSWLKRDANTNSFASESEADLEPGDLVRIQVSTTVAGRVILSRRNDSGEWQNVAEVTASANSTYAIPDAPIPVSGEAQRFRLTLDPVVPLAKDSESRTKTLAQTASPAPVSIEITLGGKRPN